MSNRSMRGIHTSGQGARHVRLPERSGSLLLSWGLAAAIVIGIVIRLVIYFSRPPIWTDEVMLHIGILRRDFGHLLQPLDYGQMAPIGFLWIQKLATTVFGWNELSVRLFPLLSGLCTIALVGIVIRELVSVRAALFGAALASISPFLIFQSNQAKQYSVEATATAALIAVCVLLVWKRLTFPSILALFLVSALALLFSAPAIFVVSCAWASVALLCWTRHVSPRMWTAVFAAATGSALFFAVLYFAVYLRAGNAAVMQLFWAPAFPGSQDSIPKAVYFIVVALIRPVFGFDDVVPAVTALAAIGLLAFGLFRIGIGRNWPLLILLAGPVAVMIAASLLRKWPLGARLLLFAAPLLVVAMSAGMEAILNASSRWRYWAFMVCFAAAMAWPFRYSVYQARHPASTDNREMVRELVDRASHDVIYIYAGGVPEWLFYSENLTNPNWERIHRWQEAAKRLGDVPGDLRLSNSHVTREGWDLVFRVGSRLELMGTASGSYADATGYHNSPPKPGWADNEADRIIATGARRVFVFIGRSRKPVTDELFDSLRKRGMQLAESHGRGTSWYLFTASGKRDARSP